MTDSLPIYESLAASVRRLIDATIRTEVGHDVIAAATAKIDSVTTELSAELMPGTFGEREVDDGQGIASGNVVIGVRNPSAPPLVVHHEKRRIGVDGVQPRCRLRGSRSGMCTAASRR